MNFKTLKQLLVEAGFETLICKCNDVTFGKLMNFIKFNPYASKQEIFDSLKIGKGCGCCVDKASSEGRNCKGVTYYADLPQLKNLK